MTTLTDANDFVDVKRTRVSLSERAQLRFHELHSPPAEAA